MSAISTSGSPAPVGLLCNLRSWLRASPNEASPSSETVASERGGPNVQSFSSIRVLVVDDNPLNLMLISALMESKGLVPMLAADGAEAVALACEMPFDLILMDLQMPVLDGFGATEAIRSFETSGSRPAVPVVAYSCNSPVSSVLASHGINGLLAKPCNDQDLEACLTQWCPTYRAT
jgi:two-component system sensor histidine kinase/response regulator